MQKNYIEKRDDGYWITETRISLDSVVMAFNRGASAETIKRSFPLLSLEEVYGAITFYLANQAEINKYLTASEKKLKGEAEMRRAALKKANPKLVKRLEEIKNNVEMAIR